MELQLMRRFQRRLLLNVPTRAHMQNTDASADVSSESLAPVSDVAGDERAEVSEGRRSAAQCRDSPVELEDLGE
jgi:hypothetical protein